MFVLERINEYAKTNRVALVNRGESVGYARLDARSDAFAAYLLERFGNTRTPVVILGDKESDFLSCIFGALKSGRGYVPVDSALPPARTAEIISDIRPDVIVDFSGRMENCTNLVGPDALSGILERTPVQKVPRTCWVSEEDTAYILFTSGSTGRPKGVPITVRNLTSFYRGFLPFMDGEEGGVILNQVSYSFDVSCCAVFAGLSKGMTLFTVDRAMSEELGTLFKLLKDSSLTMWVSTPSFAELCVQSKSFNSELMPFLSKLLFCGEVLTRKLCSRLSERFEGAEILNTYGPTEATVLVTAVRVTPEMITDSLPIPIGYPIEGLELRVVDGNGQNVEDEERGELLIIGDSVSPGYHQRPDLTVNRFFTDEKTNKRGYRTGDVCYRKDGLYYYQGRADGQLKLNGYRVELEDIENNLAKVDNVLRAAVVAVYDGERAEYLTAFIMLEREDGFTPLKRAINIKKQAAAFLPGYMIPRKIIAVEAFPLNASGKVDKKALAGRLREVGTT